MITFNELLRSEGIDPAHVKLVRHQDKRFPGRPTPYQLWKAGDGRYELYQKIQRRPVFDRAQLLASFVATPPGETLFVGLFAIIGVGTAPIGLIDPITNKDVGGLRFYGLTPASELTDYRGRLVIDWGKGFRAWVQLARKKDKSVVEIRRPITN